MPGRRRARIGDGERPVTGSGDQALTDVLPVIFLMPLAWLVAFGAGPLSLDYLLKKRFGLPATQPRKVLV